MKKDLSGKKFGRLTAIRRTDEKDKYNRCYLWECLCGNKCFVPTDQLISGNVKSCGCLQRENREVDITGQKFGMLTAIKPTGEIKNHSRVWLWKCDCGNTVEATSDQVKYGDKRSCGCWNTQNKKKQAIKMQKNCGRQDETSISQIKSTIIPKNNTSGYKGVSWHKGVGKWHASIGFQGKSYSLGYFDDPKEASEAYQKAREELHGEYLREHGFDFKR